MEFIFAIIDWCALRGLTLTQSCLQGQEDWSGTPSTAERLRQDREAGPGHTFAYTLMVLEVLWLARSSNLPKVDDLGMMVMMMTMVMTESNGFGIEQ